LQSFIKNKRLAGKAVSAAASVAISVAAAAAVATCNLQRWQEQLLPLQLLHLIWAIG